MKILSIDVGIKNLAYCLFFLDDIHSFEIDSWDVVNLCNDEIVPTCCYIKKNKTGQCTNKSKYFIHSENYCKIHCRHSGYVTPSAEYNYNGIKNGKLFTLKQFCEKNEISIDTCQKKAHYLKEIQTFFKERVLISIQKKKSQPINLVLLGRNMQTTFDALFDKHNIDCVIIENQISPIANRMKTLQGMIAQYFIMKQVPTIDFVSSRNKLKEFCSNEKMSYAERKKKAIDVMYTLFKDNTLVQKWEHVFSMHAKKDDLADCFLQGYWYLKQNELYIIED